MRALAAAAALVVAACAPALAPHTPASIFTDAASDSVDARRVLRDARGAQQRFERIRWSTLDHVWRPASGGTCDEIIGRFCLWYTGDGNAWEPPDEPPRLLTARDQLLVDLRGAAERSPADGWVHGQLVRYLVEAEDFSAAVTAARACAAEGWWCNALLGFALHAAGDFVASERAFSDALARMPEAERHRWGDISPLLNPRDHRAWRRMSQAQQDSLARRFWWLADPLYSVPGNERRTEHLSRLVLDRIFRESRTQEQVSWGDDTREILLRFGAPRGWERIRPGLTSPIGYRSVVSHYEPYAREFVPSFDIVARPAEVAPGAWRVSVERPRTEYRPAYARIFGDVPAQVAAFRRDGRAVVVAAYQLPPDSIAAGVPVRAALVHATHESSAPRVTERVLEGARGAIAAELPFVDGIVSVEVRSADGERAARARHGLSLRRLSGSGFAISDVLLLDGGDPPEADSLPLLMRRARGAVEARSGEAVALYWELYGLAEAGEEIGLEISLQEERRRSGIQRALGLGRGAAGVDMRWREYVRGPLWSRVVDVQLGELPPGVYTLEVTATRHRQREGAGEVRASRRVVITR